MLRRALLLSLAPLVLAAAAPVRDERSAEGSLSLRGEPLELVAARGSLWVLTCDTGCSGEAHNAIGRIVRIDPQRVRVVESIRLRRPGAIAVGSKAVYATDFWRDAVRRIDLRTRAVRRLKLKLPFRFTARDNRFLPEDVAAGAGAVWIVTDRGALARVDPSLRRVISTVRLPLDAFGGMAAGRGRVWVSESLAGVYRVDPRTRPAVARIRIPLAAGRFDAGMVVPAAIGVLVIGDETSGGVYTGRNVLVRVGYRDGEVKGFSPLPPGPLSVAFGKGSLWVARSGGSSVERIDPRTGRPVRRVRAKIGSALAFAGDSLWTIFLDGTLRRLGPAS